MSPILVSPPSSPSMEVLIACASTGSAATAKPAARHAATKPRRSTCTSGSRLLRWSFCKSLRLSSMVPLLWWFAVLTLLRFRIFRPALPACSLDLEAVRELEDAEVVAVATDDLQADRQTLGREAGRHRERRVAGDGDVVAAFHPVEVVAHFYAGDLARPLRLDRIRRQLVHRAEEELVSLEEAAHAVEQLAAQRHRPGDFFGRELEPLLDVPDDVVLQLVAVLFEQAAKARDIAHRAQRLEGLGGAGEVRLGFLDHAAEVLEDLLLRFQHGAHARVHRQA